MNNLLLLVALCVGPGTTLAQDPCKNVNVGVVTPSIPLPFLPLLSFKAVVRAEILNRNFTVEATEYADHGYNAATVVMNQNGTTYSVIMSYDTDQVLYYGPDPSNQVAGVDTCFATNLTTDDNTQLFGMNTGGPGSVHLFSTAGILNFINGSEVYKGQTIIDEVPCNKWSRCAYWPELNANFTLDYYFTVPGWQTPSGLDQVPLRAEVQGIKTNKTSGAVTNFHHVYQYVNFEPYVNDPDQRFETPPGVDCINRKPPSWKKLPQLSNKFYYREEISTFGDEPSLEETDIWYDYDLQLLRYDQREQPSGVSADLSGSNGPFTVIHDYTLGVQYAIAKDIQKCSMDPIPLDARGFDSLENKTGSRDTLRMRNPWRFLNLDNSTFQFAGTRKARGQWCDVYQALLTNIPGALFTLYEVYFLAGAVDTSDRGSQLNALPKAIPMRILLWQGEVLAHEYDIHDWDQDSPLNINFDVSACFPGTNSIDFEINLKMAHTTPMPQLAPYVQEMIQTSAFLGSGLMTPLRLQHPRMHWDANSNVFFQATLIGAVPSLAKYEKTIGSQMTGNLKTLPNVYAAKDCITSCDTLTEFTCVQADFCISSNTCVIARPPTPVTLSTSLGCDHYQRVLGAGFDAQIGLTAAWIKLQNSVLGEGKLIVTLPLPDQYGVVDMSIDTSTLDPSQKVTLTAATITNEVVSNVNRDGGTASVMTQFQVIPQKAGKGYDDVERGLSVDDCAQECVDSVLYNCQSFHYCWEAGTCFLSRQHPDERPNMLKTNLACDLYIRDYTTLYQQFDGLTVLSDSNVIYQYVLTASECAKLCLYYSGFHCESFDFCTDLNTCYLGSTHYYDAPKANIQQMPACVHFSLNYVNDFKVTAHKQVALRDNRVIAGVSPQQCAKLCVEESTFTCSSFDYCGNFTECRLSDAAVTNTGQTTLQNSASCDVYSRSSSSVAAAQTGTNNNDDGKFSTGSMGGLAVGMIVLGMVMGIAVLVLWEKFRGKRGGGDGMTIAFSKQELSDS